MSKDMTKEIHKPSNPPCGDYSCTVCNSMKKKPNWEKEFDKKFADITHISCADKSIKCGTMAMDVKSFIKEALKSQQAEFKKELRTFAESRACGACMFDEELSDILKEI